MNIKQDFTVEELISRLQKVENKKVPVLLYFDGEVANLNCVDDSECNCTQGHARVELNADYECIPDEREYEYIRVCDINERIKDLNPKSLIQAIMPIRKTEDLK